MNEALRRSIIERMNEVLADIHGNDSYTLHDLARLESLAGEMRKIKRDNETRQTITNHNGANHGH